MGNRFDDNRLTLRIHRGRGSTTGAPAHHESPHSNGSTHSTTTSIGSASPERLSRYSTRGKLSGAHHHATVAHHEKIKISVSYPSTENVAQSCHSVEGAALVTSGATGGGSSGGAKLLYAVHYSSANGRSDSTASQIFRRPSKEQQQMSSVLGGSSQYLTVSEQQQQQDRQTQQQQGRQERGSLLSPRASKRMGKRNIKAQVKRFRMETKAAKTLAIIVGLFVLCWLPFFTMYLVRPFCDDCINELLFSIVFWIGYCNSAINPMIYALFSKDFRFAFKRIICRCFCAGGRYQGAGVGSRRGSDMSQMRAHGGRTPSISPSAAAQSLCDDSDPAVGGDLSDSRCRTSYAPSISSTSSPGCGMMLVHTGGQQAGGRSSSIGSVGTVVTSVTTSTGGTVATTTTTSTVRTPNVYDICHPLVMENPATSSAAGGGAAGSGGSGGSGGGGGSGGAGHCSPLHGHPLAPLPPLRGCPEPDSSRSLRRLNICSFWERSIWHFCDQS